MPKLIVHLHLNEHITRIQQTLAGHLFAVAEFDNFFRRNEHLTKTIGESECLCPGLQRFSHLLFETGISVDDVPMFGIARLIWTGSSIRGGPSRMRGVLGMHFLGRNALVGFERVYVVVFRQRPIFFGLVMFGLVMHRMSRILFVKRSVGHSVLPFDRGYFYLRAK